MITRFAEYVAQEIEAGRFTVSRGHFDDKFYILSLGINGVADEDEYRKHFSLSVGTQGWFWNRRKHAYLRRGREYNLPITQAEHDRLYDVYQIARDVDKERKRQRALEKDRERQRLTDWP